MADTNDRVAVAVLAHAGPQTFKYKSRIKSWKGRWSDVLRAWKIPVVGDEHALRMQRTLGDLGIRSGVKRIPIEPCPQCGEFLRPRLESGVCIIGCTAPCDTTPVRTNNPETAVKAWNLRCQR